MIAESMIAESMIAESMIAERTLPERKRVDLPLRVAIDLGSIGQF
jgi:hypothetical protein